MPGVGKGFCYEAVVLMNTAAAWLVLVLCCNCSNSEGRCSETAVDYGYCGLTVTLVKCSAWHNCSSTEGRCGDCGVGRVAVACLWWWWGCSGMPVVLVVIEA